MGGFRIGRIAGIDIQIHWSWFAIFTLLTWWLAEGFFAAVYEDWTRAQAWTAAIITTLLFFTSVLLHELSHSLMAKRLGLPVPNITLFIFGGVSSLGREPAEAKDEFRIAIVGPLTSFIIGGLCGLLAFILWQADQTGTPVFAVSAYLAFINVAVGIFNMLPGFPLDGGRVLRAGLWARSGSMLKATKWASGVGQGIAFALMAAGVVLVLLGGLIGGIWFIVIGWFLRNASEASYQQLLFRSTLEGKKVGEMVNRAFQPAPPDVTLSQLVNDYILPYSQRCVPIIVSDDLLGLVSMSDLKRVPTEEWQTTSAFRAMTPREKLHVVAPEDDLTQALEVMASQDVHQLPVIDGRDFLGFVTRADVLRLIQIRSEFSGVAEEEQTPA
jgi:Zn-dependent protease/CBS domain-containing protein